MKIASTFLRHLLAATVIVACATPSFAHEDLPKLDLMQYQGKVVYLDFWASWCAPCRRSFPWLDQLQRTLGPRGFVVVSVNVDTERELATAFLKEVPVSFGVAYDPKGELAQRWQLLGMPSSFMIDRSGKVRSSHVGFHKGDEKKREAEISALLDEPIAAKAN